MKDTSVIYTEKELETIGRLISKRSPAKQAVAALAGSVSAPAMVEKAVRLTADWQYSVKAIKRLRQAKAARIEAVIKLTQAKSAHEIMDLIEEAKARQQSVMSELNHAMIRSFLS
jgi:hypothetical protein